MTDAVIVSTARTGLGKSWKGAFNMTYGATLGAHSVRHAVERAGIDPAEVEDVIMGSTFGEGTTGGNIARAIALRAGLPVTTAGLSIIRFCSSGLQSIALAAQRIMTEGAAVVSGHLTPELARVLADVSGPDDAPRIASLLEARGLESIGARRLIDVAEGLSQILADRRAKPLSPATAMSGWHGSTL